MKLKSIFATALATSLLVMPLMATSASAAPTNDDIAIAEVISVASTSGTTVDAGKEGSENTPNSYVSTVWFKWTASDSESTTISTCDAAVSTKILIYTDAEVTAPTPVAPSSAPSTPQTLTEVGCTNGEKVTFTSVAGGIYFLQVSSTQTAEGTFTLVIGNASPPPPPVQKLAKVTMCHRTHATTNPYRLITVSTSSIVGAGSAVNGHSLHNSKVGRTDGIFNPPYPIPSQKNWGDIIPPFTSTNGGTFAGLNWKWDAPVYADDIFDKTEFRAIDATSGSGEAFEKSALQACQGNAAEMTNKQLFTLERKNGETRDDILAEFQETDPDAKTQLLTELPPREGPKNVPSLGTDQSLSGVVWLDLNENGYQEDNEPNMPNIVVTVAPNFTLASASGISPKFVGPSAGRGAATAIRWKSANSITTSELSGRISMSFRTAITSSVTTDANGAYSFPSLDDGDWTVVGVVPTGLGVTFDSQGDADASVIANVPPSGAAFTWIGLVYNSGYTPPASDNGDSPATLDSSKGPTLADTGISTDTRLLGLVGLALVLFVAGGFGIYRTRTRA